MGTQSGKLAGEKQQNGLTWLADRVARVVVVTLGYSIIPLLLAGKPTLSGSYLAQVAIILITGVVYTLLFIPLARRLPYRMWTRIISLFLPLYWIALLGNIVEAFFFTTISRAELIGGAVIYVLPLALECWLIAWLFPAYPPQEQPVPRIWQVLRQRSLLSWIWRLAVVSVLYFVFLQYVFGALTNLIFTIDKYYATVGNVPLAVYATEEMVRGLIFFLTLLPLFAVMRGRSWRALCFTAFYIFLLDAALEGWLSMLAQTSDPLMYRIGEALDLTGDALGRGIIGALFLALPTFGVRGERESVESRHGGISE